MTYNQVTNILKKYVLICSLILAVVPLAAQNISLKNLQCEYLDDPSGVESVEPKLSWHIISTQKNVFQVAYRIIVADNPASLTKNIGTIWDSKKIISDKSIQVLYAGSKPEPAKTYYWKVMIWDNKGNVSAWSNTAKWQMGLLTKEDWKSANWIAYEVMPDSMRLTPLTSEAKRKPIKDILPLFRKEFTINKTVKKATAFVAGLGHFELSINGKKAGDHFLDAGWTNYDKHALYVTFDITNQLKKGKNAMGVMLGNGFYFMPGERYLKIQLAYGYPKMISRIMVEYTDGTTEDIVSDNSWKTTAGPVTFSSIYGGEDYNATLEQKGWNSFLFNDQSWKNAITVQGPPLLNAQTATPLKIFDNFSPVKISQPKPGVWVYDLGQNASAIPRISVKGKKGSTVRLWPAELLDKNGLATTQPIGTPVYFDYTLKGEGIETWQPQFMYYGFRYVQVTGAVPQGESNSDNLPVVVSLKSLHTRNAATTAGEFSSSNDLFNKTDKLIDWAIRSNMASVLTDCPHREKLGWLEEAHLVGPSIMYTYNIAALCRKVIADMMNAQTEKGLVPDIAPEFAQFGGPFRDSPEWGSNSIIMPWYMYEWYGDQQILETSYPMMQRYISYLESKSKDGILSHGLGDWYDIGPKEPGPSQLTTKGITATAIYYYDLTIAGKVATLLGKQHDAVNYEAMAAKVKTAYNNAFFNKEKKQYGTGSQTANSISVYMNLVEPEYKDSVVANIVKELRNRNNSLTAGDIGYRYLLKVLDDNNRSDVIFDMNSNASVPGYGYQLARGATALTESWQAYDNASHNHMMLGHLKEWFYSGLAGIRPAKNTIAFKKIEIRPQPVGNVSSAKASYISPYGKIVSDWKKNNHIFELMVEIPANTSAVIYLPATQTSSITESGKPVKVVRYVNGQAVVEVGSGKYKLTAISY
ncbi:MAG: family 78 glycoside hydrolase catalytic domain [Chitinophagaceae bacterium]